MHAMAVANLHREFCTAIRSTDALGLVAANNTFLSRCQGDDKFFTGVTCYVIVIESLDTADKLPDWSIVYTL